MDSIFSIGAFILLIGLIVLVIIVQQFQHARNIYINIFVHFDKDLVKK